MAEQLVLKGTLEGHVSSIQPPKCCLRTREAHHELDGGDDDDITHVD